jgi:hypothetical protein
MAGYTDSYEAAILNWFFNQATLTPLTNVYFGLFNVNPTADAGTGGTEVTTVATGYARVAKTNNTTTWANAASRIKATGVAVTFPAITLSYGSVTGWGIWDAATAGNLICWGTFSTAKTYTTTDLADFPAGTLTLTSSGTFSNYAIHKILDHVFGATTYSPVATMYLAMASTVATATAFGTEYTTGGYARKAVTSNTTNWPTSTTGGSMLNAVQIDQMASAFSADQSDCAATALFDASTSGNMLLYQNPTPVSFITGDTPRWPVGNIGLSSFD